MSRSEALSEATKPPPIRLLTVGSLKRSADLDAALIQEKLTSKIAFDPLDTACNINKALRHWEGMSRCSKNATLSQ